MSSTRVVIIGGGLSGLTAAVALGRLGIAATVCERTEELGGRARTAARDGFHLNFGTHRLFERGAGVAVLRSLGIPIDAAPRGPNGGLAVRRGCAYTLPVGYCSLLTTDLLSARGKRELAELLTSMQATPTEAVQDLPIARWVHHHASDPIVRELVLCLVRQTTYCDEPLRLSAGAAIEQLRLSMTGDVLYLHRGWVSLVEALRAAAVAGGATIASGRLALAIDISGGRAVSVALANHTHLPADAVIVAAAPAVARALLHPAIDYRHVATELRVAALDVALRGLPRDRTVFAFGIDAPWSYSADSRVARVAPDGSAVVHVVKYLRAEGTGTAADEDDLERALDLLQPGWRRLVAHRRFMPTLPVSRAIVAADCHGFAGRPSVRVPGLANVFVAGDWVGPVGQLADAAFASAVAAANAAAVGSTKRGTLHVGC